MVILLHNKYFFKKNKPNINNLIPNNKDDLG